MKWYRGLHRKNDPDHTIKVYVDASDRPAGPAPELHHIPLHSPDGFSWGYHGSGPADLALAILADHFGERPTKYELDQGLCRCWHLHQQFKDEVVAKQPMQWDFSISTSDVELFLARHAERVAEIEDMLKLRRASAGA